MTFDLELEIEKAVAPLNEKIDYLVNILSSMDGVPMNNNTSKKEYLTIQEVEVIYGLKKSMQAKLRMDKEGGIPYIRPAGAKIVLYPVHHLNEWLEGWRAA